MNMSYSKMLAEIKNSDPRSSLVGIYHGVRKIRYGSTGVREPMEVARLGVGSCSGKHLLLRDLLRQAGLEAEIITMFTHFNKRVPIAPSYPDELKRMCREEDIPDFHHYVRARVAGRWLKLDATWHDALIPYGFAVNRDWSGDGDTILAASPIREYPNAEDLISFKMEMIATLSEKDRALRSRYFALLTEWIGSL